MRGHRFDVQSLCKFYSYKYSLSGATWLTVIIFSKTVCKYSHFLLLELKNIVSILECVLPKLNIEESCLLAILLDQNSKHAEQAQRVREMYMRNSEGASSCKTDFLETRKG